jgi:hypothetical protein
MQLLSDGDNGDDGRTTTEEEGPWFHPQKQ